MCRECGYEAYKWLGKCSDCGNYNTMFEQEQSERKTHSKTVSAVSLQMAEAVPDKRMPTQIPELDRVLSGGIVDGSLTLVGGDPGIGKSTLLLQLCQTVGGQGHKILYVSGEESVGQIKMRAERLKITTKNLFLLAETNMSTIEPLIKEMRPKLVIIDSIQTISCGELPSSPGSVTQVREATSALIKIAKGMNISVVIIGHVTKDGNLAGPRVLEHMVDTVLYFEGERIASYRIIRAVKNRFGSTNEIGVFEMRDIGLTEIANPSEYMLAGRPLNVPGSAVTCSVEGTRPILTEVQALVSGTAFGQPRRMATGMDYNRVVMLIAVLEKRAGLQLAAHDIYANLAGGIKIAEPSLDAAVTAAIASSYRNKIIDPYTMIFGEVGLTGEIRAVTMAEKRVSEAAKLGFKKCIVPKENLKGIKQTENMTLLGVSNVGEVLDLLE